MFSRGYSSPNTVTTGLLTKPGKSYPRETVIVSGHALALLESPPIEASLDVTVSSATLTAIGGSGHFGSVSVICGDTNMLASGRLHINGALTQTAGDTLLTSLSKLSIKGGLSQTVASASLSGTGLLALHGSLTATTANVTASTQGKLALHGSLTQSAGDSTLSATGGVPAAWTPASLTSLGAWYDPSDFSTMWQDSAKTTPVTASGQPVGYIEDKGPNGFHLLQATSGNRPTLIQDANSNWYLEFVYTNRCRLDPAATDLGSFHKGVSLFFIAAATQAVTNGAGGVLGWLGSPSVEFGHSVEGLRTGWTALGRRLN